MSGTRSLGVLLATLGLLGLLVGAGMADSSTTTSQTCVDNPVGYGQECYTGSVTTPNPAKGPLMGGGVLALLCGVGVALLGGRDSDAGQRAHTSDPPTDGGEAPTQSPRRTAPGTVTFADELRAHQAGDDRPTATGDGPEPSCPSCGRLVAPQNNYCEMCGAELSGSADASDDRLPE